jgi:WD40 repeat protein
LLAAAAVLLVGVVLAGLLAVRQRNRADSAGTLAEARRLGTQALVVDDYDQALLLSVEGRHLRNSLETNVNLLATIERSPDDVRVIRDRNGFNDLAVTPDGKTLLVSTSAGISIYDAATGEKRASYSTLDVTPRFALSPDGHTIAVVDATGTPNSTTDVYRYHVQLVDTASFAKRGNRLRVPPKIDGYSPTRLTFSPDGRFVAGVLDRVVPISDVPDAVAFVWDVAKGGGPVLQVPFTAPERHRDVAFLPDSSAVLVASPTGSVAVDVRSGAEVRRLSSALPPLAVSPDGKRLAAALDPDALVLGVFDLASGDTTATLPGHSEQVDRLAFSPDGKLLATGGDDAVVMLWDAASGARRAVFTGHANGVRGLAFSPDRAMLYSASLDQAVHAWDLRRSSTLVHRLPPDALDLQQVAFDAGYQVTTDDGSTVAYQDRSNPRVQFQDVATGALSPPANVGFLMAFSPNGRQYVTGTDDGSIELWDRALQKVVARRSPTKAYLFDKTAYSPDGHRLVTTELDKDAGHPFLQVLDATTLAPIWREPLPINVSPRDLTVTPDGRRAIAAQSTWDSQLTTRVTVIDLTRRRILHTTQIEQPGKAQHSAFAPDGRTVAVGCGCGQVRIVDPETGATSSAIALPVAPSSIAFAPDGKTFVTAGEDGAVRLWDTATRLKLGEVQPLGPNKLVWARFVGPDRVLIYFATGEIFGWDPRPDAWEAHACRGRGAQLHDGRMARSLPQPLLSRHVRTVRRGRLSDGGRYGHQSALARVTQVEEQFATAGPPELDVDVSVRMTPILVHVRPIQSFIQ